MFSLLVTVNVTELYRRLKWVARGAAALPAPSTPKAASTVKSEAAHGPGTKRGRGARSPERPKGVGREVPALGPDLTRPRLAGNGKEPSLRRRESIFSVGR